MLKVKDTRTNGQIHFSDLSVGDVYEDDYGFINIKVADNKCLFENEDGVWEVLEVKDEWILPLEAELVIKGKK